MASSPSADLERSPRGALLAGAGAVAAVLAAVAALSWTAAAGGSYRQLAAGIETAGAPNGAARLAALAPRGLHLRIDTAANRLWLYRGDEVLREAVCSTGSGVWLRDTVHGREWIFDTPLGERRVRSKVRDPVWTKPDWAFVEDGVEPPAAGDPARFDSVSLGDYALNLGDGYLIHGTLFQSLLGRSLTHGCVRLGDEDLEYVYRQLPAGAPVYLY